MAGSKKRRDPCTKRRGDLRPPVSALEQRWTARAGPSRQRHGCSLTPAVGAVLHWLVAGGCSWSGVREKYCRTGDQPNTVNGGGAARGNGIPCGLNSCGQKARPRLATTPFPLLYNVPCGISRRGRRVRSVLLGGAGVATPPMECRSRKTRVRPSPPVGRGMDDGSG